MTIEYWLQLENRPWDLCPHNIDRMSGQDLMTLEPATTPVSVQLTSTSTGLARTVTMFKPIKLNTQVVDALIYRRYKPPTDLVGFTDAWTVPDDRKVNPWDLNEPDPGEHGTMGTIPGPVIEASVGDDIVVHFRNMDMRHTAAGASMMAIEHRCHSIHPHGVVFKPASDGAYPLSPPDGPGQPVAGHPGPDETALWGLVPGFAGPFKKGDRVPPGGTFTYTWNTFGWGATAGVWLYHDHSICDMDNVELGAIGFIVVHNPQDLDDVDIRDPNSPATFDPAQLPGGSPTGSPVFTEFLPIDQKTARLGLLQHQLEGLVPHSSVPHVHNVDAGGAPKAPPAPASFILRDLDHIFQVSPTFDAITAFGVSRYRTPPTKLLALQLFHKLGDVWSCINGRQFLGNTPTILSGPGTLMRFGVVGMGSEFHTFHLHGHRWVIPGPDGNNSVAIQNSVQKMAVSQFEDTRTFGPANSFVFTINGASGSFMRAGGPAPDDSLGEWHMHCHVLNHMMMGMMGSLLIVKGGEVATRLPRGVPCPPANTPGGNPQADHVVNMQNSAFSPASLMMTVGQSLQFMNMDGFDHTVTWDTAGSPADSGNIAGGATWPTMPTQVNAAGTFNYHCDFHGAPGIGMHGSIVVM